MTTHPSNWQEIVPDEEKISSSEDLSKRDKRNLWGCLIVVLFIVYSVIKSMF